MAIIAGPSVLHRAIAYSGSSHNWVENFPKQNLSVRSPAISTFECLKAASAALRCWDVIAMKTKWKRTNNQKGNLFSWYNHIKFPQNGFRHWKISWKI